ncbi:MAG: hypothetical protein OQK82_02945 [Candidatus Pacearchaeota archaeon]|nr:hypothetical protein [Candidatus Pacearchaeota archaeon]
MNLVKKELTYQLRRFPYCDNLFEGLAEDEVYEHLLNIIIGLDMKYLSFEGIEEERCKIKGNISNQDTPLLYSFNELYDFFVRDYVHHWLNTNK